MWRWCFKNTSWGDDSVGNVLAVWWGPEFGPLTPKEIYCWRDRTRRISGVSYKFSQRLCQERERISGGKDVANIVWMRTRPVGWHSRLVGRIRTHKSGNSSEWNRLEQLSKIPEGQRKCQTADWWEISQEKCMLALKETDGNRKCSERGDCDKNHTLGNHLSVVCGFAEKWNPFASAARKDGNTVTEC